MSKYLDQTGLLYFWSKIKEKINSEIQTIYDVPIAYLQEDIDLLNASVANKPEIIDLRAYSDGDTLPQETINKIKSLGEKALLFVKVEYFEGITNPNTISETYRTDMFCVPEPDTLTLITSYVYIDFDTRVLSFESYQWHIGDKQDNLVSGTNIKTVNGKSLLGSGNITIDTNPRVFDLTSYVGEVIPEDILRDITISPESALLLVSTYEIYYPIILSYNGKDGNDINYYGSWISVEECLVRSCCFKIDGDTREFFRYDDFEQSYVTQSYFNTELNEVKAIAKDASDLCNDMNTDVADLYNNKQDKLVSGTNIKTVNGKSLLGSGNITIEGGSGSSADAQKVFDITDYIESSDGSSTYGTLPQEIVAELQTLKYKARIFCNERYYDYTSMDTMMYYHNVSVSGEETYFTSSDLYIDTEDYSFTADHYADRYVQDVLQSGTNIKTVNGQSLLGSGNINTSKFKVLNRHTLGVNGYVDLLDYMNNYDELMIIVRVVPSAASTIGIGSTTSGSSNFLTSVSVSGTSYLKITLNKTDEDYFAWTIIGSGNNLSSFGWTSSIGYQYLRNYTTGSSMTMSVVIHGR